MCDWEWGTIKCKRKIKKCCIKINQTGEKKTEKLTSRRWENCKRKENQAVGRTVKRMKKQKGEKVRGSSKWLKHTAKLWTTDGKHANEMESKK